VSALPPLADIRQVNVMTEKCHQLKSSSRKPAPGDADGLIAVLNITLDTSARSLEPRNESRHPGRDRPHRS